MAKLLEESSFGAQFRKFRLRSQIPTLSRFGDLLATAGCIYENSLFSRWQNNERIPRDRNTLLKIIEVFVQRGGIRSIQDANLLLASAEQRDLSGIEQKKIEIQLKNDAMSVNELVAYDRIVDDPYIDEKSVRLFGLLTHLLTTKLNSSLLSRLSRIIRFYRSPFILNAPIGGLSGYYFALFIWWIFLNIYTPTNSPLSFAYAFAYSFLPLLGGVTGLVSAQKWDTYKSSMGKSLLFFSFGLITWGIGELIWSYYAIFLQTAVPYPSWADAAFILSWPLWGLGLYFLSVSVGVSYGLRTYKGKMKLYLIPTAVIFVSYYLLVVVAREGKFISSSDMLKIFFDLSYPIFDVVLITGALLILSLASGHTQTRYRLPLFIILGGIIVNYFADFGFSYTTTKGTFYNGCFVDLLFATAMYIISVGVNSFESS